MCRTHGPIKTLLQELGENTVVFSLVPKPLQVAALHLFFIEHRCVLTGDAKTK